MKLVLFVTDIRAPEDIKNSDILSKSFFDDMDKEDYSDDGVDKGDWRIGRVL